MKRKILASCLLLCFGLAASTSTIQVRISCRDGVATSGNCAAGRVRFRGVEVPGGIHVRVVRDSDGLVYDDWDYVSDDAELDFTETLSPRGSYSVTFQNESVLYTINLTTE